MLYSYDTLLPETDKLAIAGDLGRPHGISAKDLIKLFQTFEEELVFRIKERQRYSLEKCKIVTCTEPRADLSRYCIVHVK